MTFRKFILTAMIASILPCLSTAAGISEKRQKFISYALSFQGVPYVYGGTTPKGFDCSGFVGYASNHGIGHQLPRQAAAMYEATERITAEEREPGDLMFFKNNLNSDRITHVGIYCGVYHSSNGANPQFEGKRVFISAVSDGPRTGVILTLIDERFWKNHFFAYGRFLPPSGNETKKPATVAEKKSAGSAKPAVAEKQAKPAEKPVVAQKQARTEEKPVAAKTASSSGTKPHPASNSSVAKSGSSSSKTSSTASGLASKPKVSPSRSEDSVTRQTTVTVKKHKAPAKKPSASSGKY